MFEQSKKIPCCTGLLAHVDAGKTTLCEGLLYRSGARRQLGRVDRGDGAMDHFALERRRGITIFSKQALVETPRLDLTLIDTPGHVDFAAEAERVMPILDCGILVLSGTDGIQAHTLTLWELLERYKIPTFVFVNKTDLPGVDREKIWKALEALCPQVADASQDEGLEEAAALCGEELLEAYLQGEKPSDQAIQALIGARKLLPVCFGSALKLEGVDRLLELIDRFAPRPARPESFSARVYKISRDQLGNRLTWMKLTGGTLSVRDPITYKTGKNQEITEKIRLLQRYSGKKALNVETARAGQTVAAAGLSATYTGQCLGDGDAAQGPILEPILSYGLGLPAGMDPEAVLPKLRLLEEEEPALGLSVVDGQIQVRLMGPVQKEVFCALVKERFDLDVSLDAGRICYKETILAPVEGVGHYEPLRHYAEVHLLLEPGPRGSGLEIGSRCSTDLLEANVQSLILTHLQEKIHRGVLIGAPITDMKITLMSGRAHEKHTEGGDFRQATYRALRQGLMKARSQLLEPWYRVSLTVPTEQIGRAITDLRAMSGSFDPPETLGEFSLLRGLVPAGAFGEYDSQVAAYTRGRGRVALAPAGYAPCHDAPAVIAAAAYDPEGDPENSPDSIFCVHGAGTVVKWDRVEEKMHLESCLKTEKPQLLTRNLRLDDRELEAIMDREFGAIKRPHYAAPQNQAPTEPVPILPPQENYLIVDGYNVLHAWPTAAEAAKTDLEAGRRLLMDALCSFAAFRKWEVLLVFDGYKVPGNLGEKLEYHNIFVVFTKENESGDRYIEALAQRIGGNRRVWIASSDALIQVSGLRSGVLRMSARELIAQLEAAQKEMREKFLKS